MVPRTDVHILIRYNDGEVQTQVAFVDAITGELLPLGTVPEDLVESLSLVSVDLALFAQNIH